MATTEHTMNDAIAARLRLTRKAWRPADIVRSENTGMLKGGSKRPDILILEPNVSPVVLETEVMPAVTVEADALSRLGEQLRTTGRPLLSSLAIRLPFCLRALSGLALEKELAAANNLEVAVYTGESPTNFDRWPKAGWITGSISEISVLAQSASVPPHVIDRAADHLVEGVSEAAGLLAEMADSNPGAIKKISECLCQHDSEQTRRMASAIMANAFLFHEALAGGPGKLADVLSLDSLRNSSALTKTAVLNEWRKILKVNYWPIFDIARRMLEQIPTAHSKRLVALLAETSTKMLESQLMRSHDLTGAVFQRLIADRKFLAAYYTTPASAALLSGLAIRKDVQPNGASWADGEATRALRIADFACGTGTLLSSAYQRIGQLHELHGGDTEKIHPDMMAKALVGCDVLPAAAHLTASMLSGAHPTTTYKHSSVFTVAYGRQPDESMALGSLDLLAAQSQLDILAVTAKAAHGTGESDEGIWSALPHRSFDLVMMNPPFTRATGHEGKKIGVPNPMFAAFSSDADEQKAMSKATAKLTKGTSAHGNAGEASIFLVLADRKLKDKGSLGLVMPLSLLSGEAWEDSRQLLKKSYTDLILISISGSAGSREMSFSADTGMGECLVVGQKGKVGSNRATFVVLENAPEFPIAGAIIAEEIRKVLGSGTLRKLEEGPVGGTPIKFGDTVIGYAINAPIPAEGGWNPTRINDLALAQTAYQLALNGSLWLPSVSQLLATKLPICKISDIGSIGPYHSDIDGASSSGKVRGPFSIKALKTGAAPTYPILWAHDAPRESHLVFEADCEAVPKEPKDADEAEVIDSKVESVWKTASHCHFNQNFQFNSQPTAMQFTTRKTIGGRAWLALSLLSESHEKALVLWANTTVGLLLHWWHANKQQSGRGSIGKTALETLPTLDVNTLSSEQIAASSALFDSIATSALLPLHEIAIDKTRALLDRRFGIEVLGLDSNLFVIGGPMDLLRRKFSLEPSIRGTK